SRATRPGQRMNVALCTKGCAQRHIDDNDSTAVRGPPVTLVPLATSAVLASGFIAGAEGSCRDSGQRDRTMNGMSDARRDDGIRQAVTARERGRAKVRSTTTAVTMASVVTAGALAPALPGPATKTTPSGPTATGPPLPSS